MTAKYLIIGQGDIGLPVTNILAKQGYLVTGLARRQREQYDLQQTAQFIQADALQLTATQIAEYTHMAIIVTPDTYNTLAYKQTYYGIAEHIASLQSQLPNLQQVVFISSTGVYGQDDGEWIDETVVPKTPKHEASEYILQAEQVLQHAFGKRLVVVRPSGIYGVNRLMRIRQATAADKKPMPRYAWTNRIMDSDLVNIIVNIMTLEPAQLKPLYLATDYAPVTSYELTYWLCQQLDAVLPKISETGDAVRISGKRLHSNIPRDWLQYPDWQSGYATILNTYTESSS